MLQKLWNPFRDWNSNEGAIAQGQEALQKLWNPFRDWNPDDYEPEIDNYGFKNSETLLGIETLETARINL